MGTLRFENCLFRLLLELGRRIVELACNHLEPMQADLLPSCVMLSGMEFRWKRRTRKTVFCRFGQISLWRYLYQPRDPMASAFFPLDHSLGLVGGLATIALADLVGKFSADFTQTQVQDLLRNQFAVKWSISSLRKVTVEWSKNVIPFRFESQVQQLCTMLGTAFKQSGECLPVLALGRDGTMIPLRSGWHEAATATLTVYDRAGKRVGSVYLGQMPQSMQSTLSVEIMELLNGVLKEWKGPLPRFHYVTDAGSHPREFYKRHLARMKHPESKERLNWTWCVDFYHVVERIKEIADALFGPGKESIAWARQQCHELKHNQRGITRLLQRVQGIRNACGLKGSEKIFETCLSYLQKYAKHMKYADYRGLQLPIGSGVTEAACKMIFGYRFKQSGMRWSADLPNAKAILDLRTILKSGIWEAVRRRYLLTFTQRRWTSKQPPALRTAKFPGNFAVPA
jgi:hypothetical protein